MGGKKRDEGDAHDTCDKVQAHKQAPDNIYFRFGRVASAVGYCESAYDSDQYKDDGKNCSSSP